MIKNISVISLILFLAGCGAIERQFATLKGYSKICVEGVSYLQFTSGSSVQYNPDGTIRKCQ